MGTTRRDHRGLSAVKMRDGLMPEDTTDETRIIVVGTLYNWLISARKAERRSIGSVECNCEHQQFRVAQ